MCQLLINGKRWPDRIFIAWALRSSITLFYPQLPWCVLVCPEIKDNKRLLVLNNNHCKSPWIHPMQRFKIALNLCNTQNFTLSSLNSSFHVPKVYSSNTDKGRLFPCFLEFYFCDHFKTICSWSYFQISLHIILFTKLNTTNDSH